MDILLFILSGLLVTLVVASWSGARSFFEKGRLQGMEEATREIVRGLSSHYELEGRTTPARDKSSRRDQNRLSKTLEDRQGSD